MGGILGVLMTVFVMQILACLSTSGILNLYYGGVLLFLGSVLTFRVYRKSRVSLDSDVQSKRENTTGVALNDSVMLSNEQNQRVKLMTSRLEFAFSVVSLIAGAMAIFLEKQWFKKIDDNWKVPIYGMMGSSYAFLLIYALVEFLEMLKEGVSLIVDAIAETYNSMFGSEPTRHQQAQPYVPLVVINLQYFVLILASLTSGGIFGVLFGVIDIEKWAREPGYMLLQALVYEVVIFAPVGFIHGALTGFVFMTLRFCENKKRIERNISTAYGGAYRGFNENKGDDEDRPLIKNLSMDD